MINVARRPLAPELLGELEPSDSGSSSSDDEYRPVPPEDPVADAEMVDVTVEPPSRGTAQPMDPVMARHFANYFMPPFGTRLDFGPLPVSSFFLTDREPSVVAPSRKREMEASSSRPDKGKGIFDPFPPVRAESPPKRGKTTLTPEEEVRARFGVTPEEAAILDAPPEMPRIFLEGYRDPDYYTSFVRGIVNPGDREHLGGFSETALWERYCQGICEVTIVSPTSSFVCVFIG